MADRIIGIRVHIVRCVDDSDWPMVIECEFVDAHDKTHRFIEKSAIVTADDISWDTELPYPAVIACRIVGKRDDSRGREIVTIDTETPWHVESLDEITQFDVLAENLVELESFEVSARGTEFHNRPLSRPMKKRTRYPRAIDPARVGKYPGTGGAGGGFVWDAVLEYRVWCHPENGAPDKDEGNDYYYAFAAFPDALRFSKEYPGAEEPLALILQKEYIDEPSPGRYIHVKKRRVTEWSVAFLSRPRRTKNTIPDFLSPDAPKNRLAILRGTARRKT